MNAALGQLDQADKQLAAEDDDDFNPRGPAAPAAAFPHSRGGPLRCSRAGSCASVTPSQDPNDDFTGGLCGVHPLD